MAAVVTITSNWNQLNREQQSSLKTLYARILAKAMLTGCNNYSKEKIAASN
ncbi:hypothetical protein Desaci_1374 [Desulfosporosinus acidiphilus SJ4]|uniref:Uncharacterized protein n=1 Tax=Desulfosporosinus acidiphilus (strain DSM 22704 / JCM 16185 / SJ4) TaxID=646529 RepID=I4D3M3_DESAJ|nr:hypothetical protein [Desulfosporosinus acidiphilus]AFM40397.1 hypothetical protein Desaci_1374 [Desulfosporosinus acidiphilus SJ4]